MAIRVTVRQGGVANNHADWGRFAFHKPTQGLLSEFPIYRYCEGKFPILGIVGHLTRWHTAYASSHVTVWSPKVFSVYPQNMWITLWVKDGSLWLSSRSERDFIVLPILLDDEIANIINDMS